MREFLAHIGLDEFRLPANLALRVTFNVIYPAAPLKAVFMAALIEKRTRFRQDLTQFRCSYFPR
jgi:hypothetical protein